MALPLADLPYKFEAGTPNIAGVTALKTALDYVNQAGFEQIQKAENELTEYLLSKLTELSFVKVIGPSDMKDRGSVVSFVIEGVHPHDIAEGLSQKGICIRAGHHCAQVLMDHFDIPATSRISLAMYNTKEDIDRTIDVLNEINNYFK